MKRWCPYVVFLVVQIALLGYAAQARPKPEAAKTLQVRAIQIVDESGKVRAELGMRPSVTAKGREVVALTLRDEAGKEWVNLRADEASGTLELGAFGKGYVLLSSNYPPNDRADRQRTILSLDRGGGKQGGGGVQFEAYEYTSQISAGAGDNRFSVSLFNDKLSQQFPSLDLSKGQQEIRLIPEQGITLWNLSTPGKTQAVWPERTIQTQSPR